MTARFFSESIIFFYGAAAEKTERIASVFFLDDLVERVAADAEAVKEEFES